MTTARRVVFDREGIPLVGTQWDPAGPATRGTVLLLHGGGQTRHSWRRTGERLSAEGWNALSVDARGHGESGWDSTGDYGLDSHVADLNAIVDALDEHPVLVGASLGGMTALLGLGARPSLGRALVLVDVAPSTNREGTAEIAEFMRSGEHGFASLDEVADAVAAYNPSRSSPANRDGLRRNLRKRDGRWYWHWDPQLLSARQTDPDVQEANSQRAREAARQLRVPTMLVRGSLSRVVTPDSARELVDLIPTARVVDIPGTGHMVAGDDNDVFGDHLSDFLEHSVLSPTDAETGC